MVEGGSDLSEIQKMEARRVLRSVEEGIGLPKLEKAQSILGKSAVWVVRMKGKERVARV